MPLDNRLLDRVALDRELVRRKGLRQFAELAWPIIRAEKFLSNWHVDVICDRLQALFDREFRRAIVNQPPGSMKTLLCSVLYPAWCWTVDPSESFIYASFDQGLMDQAAREHRNIVSSAWFQARWPNVKLTGTKEGGTSAREFRNTAKGWRFSTSVGGKGTGRHPNQRVVDDPVKPIDTTGSAEATRAALDACERWYDSTISTRQADPATTVDLLVMQRLNDGDLAGRLLARWGKDVEHIMLPMRFEPERAYSYDKRTIPGELLWPERFPEPVVKELEERLGQFADAQLAQNPVSASGGIYKKDWIHYWSPGGQVPDTVALPPIGYGVISWDCSFKGKETSDPSCGIVIRRAGGKFYVTDCEWGRWGFEELLEAATRLCLRNPRVIHKLVEGKANGPAVVSMLQSRFPGFEEVEPEGGKEARANAVAPLFKAGTVFFPHPSVATWTNAAVLELIRFPRGSHDDMVDAVSQGLLYLYLHGSKLGDLMAAASTNPIIQQVLKSRNGG